MLKINPIYIQTVNAAVSLEELFPMLQNAIELEHATVPPYLTAMFSIKPNTERKTWGVIHSIVIEEMLHMTIAANILNALGGKPVINNTSFVPSYPSNLPMGIGDGLIVNLEKLSKGVLKNTFMEIEEPEKPLIFPVIESFSTKAVTQFHTIGEFYGALKSMINKLAPEKLPGNSKNQVISTFFDSSLLFPILTKSDALKAIDIIVEQGEGTSISPIDLEGDIAHYYRFSELYFGKSLVKDDSVPEGFSYSGETIQFDSANIYPLFPNTKASMLPNNSEERRIIKEFNTTYALLLNGLHLTFNGNPSKLNDTIGLMYDVKLLGEKICSTPFPGKAEFNLGPSFEFE